MVTVISSKEKSTTPPVPNGVTGGSSCDNERPFQFIKDYREVDLYRTPSSKPLPEDLFDTIDGSISKSSVKGTFFLQIDALEPLSTNQNEHGHFLLTLTDGISTVKAVTNQPIANLTFQAKLGSKLLLTETIAIQNGLLQLTNENTRFEYGSNTYPRPRAAYRGNRGNGSYRPSFEGRRNTRYDNEGGENNFFKRPPPKNTLMDFMPQSNLSHDNEIDKSKERADISTKRQYNGNNPTHHSADNDQILLEQDGVDEPSDLEDDPTHANHRERRNPLPPRLQRAQEERSRRNTNRYYDEAVPLGNAPLNNQSLSSTSTAYIRQMDQGTYNSYVQSLNGSTPTHLSYYPANPGTVTYSLTSISNPSYPNHQPLIGHSYPNEHVNYYCGIPYGSYLPANVNGEGKVNSTSEHLGAVSDENNDSGMKSESSSNEQKSTTPPSSNDSQTNFQGGKRRDSNANPRPRWKIGDMCFARWSEDGEFYYATIVDIRPPFCTVLFMEYHTYDQVHFSHLKIIPRDQQLYPFMPPSSDLNIIPSNAYYPPRPNYFPSTIDGCLLMPEAPPFPFNSAGTLYMYPATSFPPMVHANDGDLTINSSSSPSKDSNDTSVIDSTTTSTDDNQQQQDTLFPQPCSIADAPLTLVTSDDVRQTSLCNESINKEQQ